MFTQSHLASVQAARLQLIDLGDEKTAKTLNWVVLALGCGRAGVHAQEPLGLLVADLLDHINTLTEQLGDAAPDQRELLAKVHDWLHQREQQIQTHAIREWGQSALAALRRPATYEACNCPEIPDGSAGLLRPLPEGVVVSAYRFNEHITIQRMSQIDGPDLWAVRNRFSDVLNVHGEWEWEPMPSSRDEGFLARCRYLSSGAAIAAAQQRDTADRTNPKA